MELTEEESKILEGSRGPVLQKALRSVVAYGELFGAERLTPLQGQQHFVTSFGASMIGPHFEMMDQLISAGLRTPQPFTVDPRPVDYAAVPCGPLEKLAFRFIYGKQKRYEAQLARVGLKDSQAFTCTCYQPEVGNQPARGAVLAWSESSAVAFANSVLGARCNRNSAGIDILCAVLGKAPLFGLLTDRGRRATWLVELKADSLPNPQLLGSAIGMKVVEAVPYIAGLSRFLGSGLSQESRDYLKDLGAAAASNGAVGLYHVEEMTPEARDQGRGLLEEGHSLYEIDEAELQRVMGSYPVLWKRPEAAPRLGFIGCPHLSLAQIREWSCRIREALERAGRSQVLVRTVLCAAPDVVSAFRRDEASYQRLLATGARLSSLCPLMYMNNPLCARKPVITNSNKLRTYSSARFLLDEELLRVIASG
jgi:predicted aconitase